MGLLRRIATTLNASVVGMLFAGLLALLFLNLSLNVILGGVLSDLYTHANESVRSSVDEVVDQTCTPVSDENGREQLEQVRDLCGDPEEVARLKDNCRALAPDYPDPETGDMCRRLLDGELEKACEELSEVGNATVERAFSDPGLQSACAGYRSGELDGGSAFVQIGLFFAENELEGSPLRTSYDRYRERRYLIAGGVGAVLMLLLVTLYLLMGKGMNHFLAEMGKLVANGGFIALIIPGAILLIMHTVTIDTSGVLGGILADSVDLGKTAVTLLPIVFMQMVTGAFLIAAGACLVCGGALWFLFRHKAYMEDSEHG